MVVQTVPFVPFFLFGIFFLFAPGLAVTLFVNSEPAGAVIVALTAVGALIRPQFSWMLLCVLFALRTAPFIMAAALAVGLRVGLAQNTWPVLVTFLAVGAIAQTRIHLLRRSGEIDI